MKKDQATQTPPKTERKKYTRKLPTATELDGKLTVALREMGELTTKVGAQSKEITALKDKLATGSAAEAVLLEAKNLRLVEEIQRLNKKVDESTNVLTEALIVQSEYKERYTSLVIRIDTFNEKGFFGKATSDV